MDMDSPAQSGTWAFLAGSNAVDEAGLADGREVDGNVVGVQ
ncbi:hypothetical protein [Brucella anthropi]|nr:hypothetical protein [Brucella anthropi]